MINLQLLLLIAFALDAVDLEFGGNLVRPFFETRIDGFDIHPGVPTTSRMLETTVSASMAWGSVETGRLHLGSGGDGGVSGSRGGRC